MLCKLLFRKSKSHPVKGLVDSHQFSEDIPDQIMKIISFKTAQEFSLSELIQRKLIGVEKRINNKRTLLTAQAMN